jgi:pimeloyl-ACP methyl ester carboxylesterase
MTQPSPFTSEIARPVGLNPSSLVSRGFSLVAAAAPGLAARVGEELMFRTRRRQASESEQRLLARARRTGVPSPHGELPVWRWGSGPPVLLVHGWNGRGAQLGALVEPLVSAGYEVVAFDAPGHGEAAGTRSSMIHFADAIEAVLESARPVLGAAHAVIAHSMGGPATILAISRLQRREPELAVGRFVLVAPPIDVNDFIRTFSRAVSLDRRVELLLRARTERRFGLAIGDLYAPALARKLQAPALVIHDREDREVPIDCGRTLASSWPGAALVETRGLGHQRILRDPEVIERIVEFVDRP